MGPVKIVVVADSPQSTNGLWTYFTETDAVLHAAKELEGLEGMEVDAFIVVADDFPAGKALEAARAVRRRSSTVAIILIVEDAHSFAPTTHGDLTAQAIAVIRAPVWGWVVKESIRSRLRADRERRPVAAACVMDPISRNLPPANWPDRILRSSPSDVQAHHPHDSSRMLGHIGRGEPSAPSSLRPASCRPDSCAPLKGGRPMDELGDARPATRCTIYVLDRSGYVIGWPARPGTGGGRNREQWHVSRFYTEESYAAGEPERDMRLASAGGLEMTAWRVREDGTRFWARILMTALDDDAKQALGFVLVLSDVSDASQATSVPHIFPMKFDRRKR